MPASDLALNINKNRQAEAIGNRRRREVMSVEIEAVRCRNLEADIEQFSRLLLEVNLVGFVKEKAIYGR